ncbi:MAG: purine-nucleoside phosphorylase [Polyangiales bacterium]
MDVSTNDEAARLERARESVEKATGARPRVGLVLGSGLGAFGERAVDAVRLPYAAIPGMPTVSVEGHDGELVVGRVAGVTTAILRGRVHLYEGRAEDDVVFGTRLLARLGCEVLVLTNAAGGIAADLAPGALLLITDHLNLTGRSPLVGASGRTLGPRFPDMTEAYDPELRALAHRVARERGIPLAEGVYAGLLGPSYETPAEIRMLRTLGADAVGMSTVLETIAARHVGLRVLGLSCITNLAAGLAGKKLAHDEVKETASLASDRFTALVEGIVGGLA